MDLEKIFQGPPTPAKWRMLGDYLKGRKLYAGEGIKITDSSSSGYLIEAKKKREIRQSQPPPFSVLSLRRIPESDPVQYAAQLQEGWVITRDTVTGNDAVSFDEVFIGGQPMSTRPRPEITLTNGDFVMCNFTTNADGYVTGFPTIEVGADTPSVHHEPASGEGSGYAGDYWVKLFKFDINAGAPTITVYQQSDIEHQRLWTGRNVGGARYIHKEWSGADDTYDFRTLEQFIPTGGTVPDYGKVIVDAVGDEFLDANDAIKFSCISERDESPQINVDDDGAGTITIKGNNKSGSLYWEYCEEESGSAGETLLTWEDGLITNVNPNPSFKAGCAGLPSGYNGDMLYNLNGNWVVLSNPGAVPAGDDHWELWHDGTSPAWQSVP